VAHALSETPGARRCDKTGKLPGPDSANVIIPPTPVHGAEADIPVFCWTGPVTGPGGRRQKRPDAAAQQNLLRCTKISGIIMHIRSRMERAKRDGPEIADRPRAENKGERNG